VISTVSASPGNAARGTEKRTGRSSPAETCTAYVGTGPCAAVGCRAEHELADVADHAAPELGVVAHPFAGLHDAAGGELTDTVDATGPWTAARAGGPPGFEAMRAVFACPVVGRKGDGRYVRSAFGWDFADAVEVRGMLWKVAWPSAASL
jgi:hypothetical protein